MLSKISITKDVLLNSYSPMKKKIQKDSDDFWNKKFTLKLNLALFGISPLLQFSKFGNFIWLQLIFSQKPSQFCIPPLCPQVPLAPYGIVATATVPPLSPRQQNVNYFPQSECNRWHHHTCLLITFRAGILSPPPRGKFYNHQVYSCG